MAVGDEARAMVGRTPDTITAYRPMKDGVIADYRVTEAMLIILFPAMGKWSFSKPEVLVSVPAGVSSTERRAVVEAATKAGAKAAYVMKEPILAAIGRRNFHPRADRAYDCGHRRRDDGRGRHFVGASSLPLR